MRKTNEQHPLAEVTTDHLKVKEFAQVNAILDSNNNIYHLERQGFGITDNTIEASEKTTG